MKFFKREKQKKNNSACLSPDNIRKKSKFRAAAFCLLLLVEGCAAGNAVTAQKRPCGSPTECRLEATEKKIQEIKKRAEALEQKIAELDKKINELKRQAFRMSVEILLRDARKRTCERFRKDLEMVKSLARYDEHQCRKSDDPDPCLRAKIVVHCPEIEYLTGLVEKMCNDGIKD